MPKWTLKWHVEQLREAGSDDAGSDLRAGLRAEKKQRAKLARENGAESPGEMIKDPIQHEIRSIKNSVLYAGLARATDKNGRAVIGALVQLAFNRGVAFGHRHAQGATVCSSAETVPIRVSGISPSRNGHVVAPDRGI